LIEKKHTALASIYLINDAIASNLAMLTAWFLHLNLSPSQRRPDSYFH